MTDPVTTKLAPRDKQGRLIASDNLPAHGHARAEALSQAGKTKDPLGLVSDELIASYARASIKPDAAKPAAKKE